MSINVIEVRNYWLKPYMTEHFIDNFETNFIEPLHALKMTVLGQFRLLGAPDHYVWLRGFSDMETRREGLDGFYSGPVWQKHRTVTNGMLLDNDDVHLIRPLGDVGDLTCGMSAEMLLEQLTSGTISTHTGAMAIDYYQAVRGERDTLIDEFKSEVAPAYEQEGIQLRGYFVAEMSENTYPRLPVIQREDEFTVVTAYESEDALRKKRAKVASHIKASLGDYLSSTESLLLSPTLRSAMRYVGN